MRVSERLWLTMNCVVSCDGIPTNCVLIPKGSEIIHMGRIFEAEAVFVVIELGEPDQTLIKAKDLATNEFSWIKVRHAQAV